MHLEQLPMPARIMPCQFLALRHAHGTEGSWQSLCHAMPALKLLPQVRN